MILPLHIVALLSLEPDYDLIAARMRYRSGQRGRAAARTYVSPAQRAAVPLPQPRPMTFDERFTAAYGETR